VKKVPALLTYAPEDTAELGRKLGGLLLAGDLICLIGELGAGKTSFAQGVARGLGVEGQVRSPSFTLIHEYYGRLPLYHLDLYRLNDPSELEDLGYEEYFYGDGVALVEWADRVRFFSPGLKKTYPGFCPENRNSCPKPFKTHAGLKQALWRRMRPTRVCGQY
jgi:tRNA threonylcarbamoyladenosine biosynthesis protein TsaE